MYNSCINIFLYQNARVLIGGVLLHFVPQNCSILSPRKIIQNTDIQRVFAIFFNYFVLLHFVPKNCSILSPKWIYFIFLWRFVRAIMRYTRALLLHFVPELYKQRQRIRTSYRTDGGRNQERRPGGGHHGAPSAPFIPDGQRIPMTTAAHTTRYDLQAGMVAI